MLILKEQMELVENNLKTIILCWIPSHIGIRENKAAENAIKLDLGFPIAGMGIHYQDYKYHMNNCIGRLWQGEWDECTGNMLVKVEPVYGDWGLPKHLSKQEAIVLFCLCIG